MVVFCAVITGSSDGIGKEYAINLAREGLNLILISRTGAKLAQLADNIRSQYDVQVRWIAVDFAEGDDVYDRIQKELANVDLGILGNDHHQQIANHYSTLHLPS